MVEHAKLFKIGFDQKNYEGRKSFTQLTHEMAEKGG